MKNTFTEITGLRSDHFLSQKVASSVHGTAIHRSSAAIPLWIQWVAVSTLGGIGGEVLALSLGTEASPAAFIIVSSMVAAGQYILLTRYLQSVYWWVALSSLAGGLGSIFMTQVEILVGMIVEAFVSDGESASFTGTDIARILGMLTAVAIASGGTGLLVGTSQWLILRSKISHAKFWIAANTLGFVLAAFLTILAPEMMRMDVETSAILNTGINFGIIAAVTGAALIKLLRLK